jgi:carbonic anhydrase/acetyltransferase-like protein (isoleucine patch superfamily)
MASYALGDLVPTIHPDAFVHPDATVIGAVTIGAYATVWPTAVLRADFGRIEIGERTSIQDGTVIHTTEEWPTIVGANCVVGHNAHLEGCVVGDGCLVGSGSIVLNRARIEAGAGVGAAALVSEGMLVRSGEMALGVPARTRPVPDSFGHWIVSAVEEYVAAGIQYRKELRRLDG